MCVCVCVCESRVTSIFYLCVIFCLVTASVYLSYVSVGVVSVEGYYSSKL